MKRFYRDNDINKLMQKLTRFKRNELSQHAPRRPKRETRDKTIPTQRMMIETLLKSMFDKFRASE